MEKKAILLFVEDELSSPLQLFYCRVTSVQKILTQHQKPICILLLPSLKTSYRTDPPMILRPSLPGFSKSKQILTAFVFPAS